MKSKIILLIICCMVILPGCSRRTENSEYNYVIPCVISDYSIQNKEIELSVSVCRSNDFYNYEYTEDTDIDSYYSYQKSFIVKEYTIKKSNCEDFNKITELLNDYEDNKEDKHDKVYYLTVAGSSVISMKESDNSLYVNNSYAGTQMMAFNSDYSAPEYTYWVPFEGYDNDMVWIVGDMSKLVIYIENSSGHIYTYSVSGADYISVSIVDCDYSDGRNELLIEGGGNTKLLCYSDAFGLVGYPIYGDAYADGSSNVSSYLLEDGYGNDMLQSICMGYESEDSEGMIIDEMYPDDFTEVSYTYMSQIIDKFGVAGFGVDYSFDNGVLKTDNEIVIWLNDTGDNAMYTFTHDVYQYDPKNPSYKARLNAGDQVYLYSVNLTEGRLYSIDGDKSYYYNLEDVLQ